MCAFSGSFSRTAVNGNTGSRTQLCGIITSCIVLAALFLITSWFYYLPLCALAAMVEVAVLNLVDFHEVSETHELRNAPYMPYPLMVACSPMPRAEKCTLQSIPPRGVLFTSMP